MQTLGAGIYFGTESRAAFLDIAAIEKNQPAYPMREKALASDYYVTAEYSPWGDNNLKPQEMACDIKTTASLTGIVGLKQRLATCEGLVPALIKNDETGHRVIDKIIEDPEIDDFLDASNHYMQTAGWMKDLVGMGNGACRFMASADGKSIAAFRRDDITELRYEKRAKDGYIHNAFYCAEWKNVYGPIDDTVYKLPLLRDWAPWLHAAELLQAGKKEFVATFKYPGWGEHYYGTPQWYAAYQWVKYVQAVPKVKATEMDNVMRPAWQVTIFKQFWAEQYEGWDLKSDKEKEELRIATFTAIDQKLVGKDKAGKNIYIAGELSIEFGKSMAYVEIKAMERAKTDGAMLPDTAAGNSEIAFAEMVHLAMIGGNQTAGPYQSNEGGSNIREASLFQIVLTELERRYIRQLMKIPSRINGWHDKYKGKLEFIIPATALTTLDTGAGSKPITTGGVQPGEKKPSNNGTPADNSTFNIQHS